MPQPPNSPWTKDVETLLRNLKIDRRQGLTGREAKRRRDRHGANRIAGKKRKSAHSILLNQFESVIVLLLAAAALATFAVGRWVEGIAIGIVVVFNALIGFFTELRAVRSMEALEKLSQSMTRVRRNGKVKNISSRRLVPGDIVVFEAGDTVSADMRIIEAARLEADESTLTGESLPVVKKNSPVDADTPLAERSNMLFNGTAITSGSGEALVVATGMDTELGKISEEIGRHEDEQTPLEDRLDQLGRAFIHLTVALSALVVGTGWLLEKDLLLLVETGIALAVAAIPEGMPIVATIALARGMRRMARRNALVNRLSSVETLGGATMIVTDKTGTLTENRMTLARLAMADAVIEISGDGLKTEGNFTVDGKPLRPGENERLQTAFRVGALCGNAELQPGKDGAIEATGDPMEAALLVAAAKAGLEKDRLLEAFPEEREIAFDPDKRMMATVHKSNGSFFFAVKGAPEQILNVCRAIATERGEEELDQSLREWWRQLSEKFAGQGLRILALAVKDDSDADTQPYADLTFLGLACFLDPPRQGVKEAIAAARSAGIRTVMVTGDQIATAHSIAERLEMSDQGMKAMEGRELQEMQKNGIPDREQTRRILACTVFARVSPKQKLDLIGLFQAEGNIVAMTGDGVNDAPALEKADIGVAMGQRGTQVAREAADMILKDDSFATIVAAIEEGRIIFGNIRRFILFLLTISLNMILTVFFASVLDLPMPLLPLQILYLNAVTQVFPALALGMGEGRPDILKRPPRDPELPILERRHWLFIVVFAVLLSGAALGGLVFCLFQLSMERPRAQTVAFLIITFGQLLHVFNVRSSESGIAINEISRNPYVWIALAVSILLTLAILYLQPLAAAMQLLAPSWAEWTVALAFCVPTMLFGQIFLLAKRRW